MSLSWPSWFTYGNTILAFPRPIAPSAPDFLNCDVRYGRDLDKKDCKLAVAAMPRLSEGTEVEWAVNHQAAQYTLPMTIVSGEKKGKQEICRPMSETWLTKVPTCNRHVCSVY